jgi:formyl-CoA transferase
MPALEAMRVLDFTQWEAGPTCCQYLAWMGADVVKVEPLRGEPGRRVFATREGDSQYFMNHNGNKRSLALDLKSEAGRDLIVRLLPRFDVLVENQGPGVMERLGLGPEDLTAVHPSLVYVRIKGFGLSGPYSGYKSFDPLAQAASGVVSMTGPTDGPPTQPGGTFADTGTGIHAAFATLSAYVQQQREGVGQVVELSMHEVMTMFVRSSASRHWGPDAGPAPRRAFDGFPPSGLYRCAGEGPNDFVNIVIANKPMLEAFYAVVGRLDLLDDARFVSMADREARVDELKAELAPWFEQRSNEDAMRELAEAGVPASATFDTTQVFRDPHLLARDFFVTHDHPEHGPVLVMKPPFRLGASDVPMQRAPLIGEHSRQVLADELGLTDADLDAMVASGVLGDGTNP